MLCDAPQCARKCGCGGHLGLQGWRRAVGMGCMHAWVACAAHARVPLAILGAQGGGGLWAVGGLHLHGSGGQALDDEWSKPPPWWPQRTRPIHAERAGPPGSASIGLKIISTKSQTCAKGATTETRGVCQCAKTVVSQPCSSCMVHLCASTRHAPLPDTPRKFPEPFQAPGDTRCHGRWITTTGATWRDGLRAMRQGRAMQAPSRSRTPGANGRTSGM